MESQSGACDRPFRAQQPSLICSTFSKKLKFPVLPAPLTALPVQPAAGAVTLTTCKLSTNQRFFLPFPLLDSRNNCSTIGQQRVHYCLIFFFYEWKM
ncbi:hypothetical protein XELAEV_18014272mg [Xenopus laevis]|uniref:Uncharacterized protein n=1 Tax=Xenopus laevis TaxID=8355 RepID=A0A974DGH5_XENLA|nr:hypothetical protein XELAEV_18014272mg [Xenopus laevis]